jgi:UDP-glucose 4-epimerase
MVCALKVAVGRREFVSVFGGDYDTPDGTGVRDYIHVVDLAVGHVKAVDRINAKCGCVVYNLGTGNGYSVLDMVKAMEKACGHTIATKIVVCRAYQASRHSSRDAIPKRVCMFTGRAFRTGSSAWGCGIVLR